MKRHSGFTLIELMIVIAIIAILAAIALPAYQNYVGRSQVSESLVLMDGARAAIVEYYSGHGQFPPSQSSAGMPQATSIIGKYVSKVVLAPNTGALTATMFGAGIVSGCVQGRTVTLTPTAPTVGSESILWKCSSNISPVCLPSTCPG